MADYMPNSYNKINVARLLMLESGTYNDQYNRPYVSHITGDILDNCVRRVEEATEITGSLLAGVANCMVQPQAQPGYAIHIPYGFSERRIRFVMEVHVAMATGSQMIYYFQGYTSHVGINAATGSVDPTMEFIINSYIRITRTYSVGPTGGYHKDMVTESAHVVDGRLQAANNNESFLLRPQDVFTGMQSSYLESSYNYYNNGDGIVDTRLKANNSSNRSNRTNNLASHYVANIIDGYRSGSKTSNMFGQSQKDTFGQCRNFVHEVGLHENPFIRAISGVTGIPDSTTFKYGDLMKVDGNISNVTNFVSQGVALAQSHHTGQTEFWNGADRDTVVATTLSSAIPALMMELMISKIVFSSTNHDLMGRINTVIIDAKSLTSVEMVENYEMFKRRLEKEVIMDITYGNQEAYMMQVSSDLFGDTQLTISIGSNPPVTFTTPSFCDGLLTQVVTNSKEHFFGVVNDFENLINHLNPQSTNTGYVSSI